MKIKQYDWSEVEEFLEANLETRFNFICPSLSNPCCCFMASFFKSKLGPQENLGVSYSGLNLILYEVTQTGEVDRTPIAEVINAPFERVSEIHSSRGREIKAKLKGLKKNAIK